MRFEEDFPELAPEIQCLTDIYHPNIEIQANGGDVCISLVDDWTPSNTIEDIIMGLLFLLYNPNISDPLSGMIPRDMPQEDFKNNQVKIMQGEKVNELFEGYNLEENTFKDAQEAYNDMEQCEWDVLAEAAKVAWEYNLEQEKWQEEMKLFEKEEQERKEEQIKANKEQFESEAASAPSRIVQRTDFAFGKSSLQRCSTVTAPCGQANALNFIAPNKDAVLSWCPVPGNGTDSTIREEEDMDYTPPPHTESKVPTEQPSCLSWQPFCKTDRFDKPVFQRTLTC